MKLSRLPSGQPEIFYTVQGEGISTGKPSIFMRLSLCNLHCTWCDTPYTWNWENTPWETTSGRKYSKKEQIIELSVEDILSTISSYPCQHLVITGGEPLLQQKELLELISILPSSWTIEFETNGTLIPESLPLDRQIQYNVSPKLAHSGNKPELALKAEALQWFNQYPLASFKFVINTPSDLETIAELRELYNIPASKIILMPKGISSEAIRDSSEEIINHCLEHGYRFSDRLHVHVWGNERAK